MSIRWGSLIADPYGEIDYSRVRSFVSIGLALSAGVVVLLTMLGLVPKGEALELGTGAMLIPLTVGKIADGLNGRLAKFKTAKVMNGESPDRRRTSGPRPVDPDNEPASAA